VATQKVFCYYDCYLKPPGRPRLVISSQSFVPRRLIVDVDAMTFVAAVAHGLLRVLQSREGYRVQKPTCLLGVFRVGQQSRGTLRFEGFVTDVQAVNCVAQWPAAASRCFDGGSNSAVQYGGEVARFNWPAPAP
jgi:hypothetical protein